MNRINLFRNLSVKTKAVRNTPATLDSVTWGKSNFDNNISMLVFAALLIVCSVAVGCSSDKPKPVNSNSQSAMAQPTSPIATTPADTPAGSALRAAAKPVHKKVVRKAPATFAYIDKASGVSFQYPRKYSLETGDAA